jgi:hypothetical protein
MKWSIFVRDLAMYSALAIACLVGAYGAWQLPIEHGEVMAAWFQGFGTVAAIMLTLALQIRAENNVKEATRRQRLVLIGHVADLAVAAHQTAFRLRELVANGDEAGAEQQLAAAADLQAQFEKWSQLPIQNWPIPSLAVAVDALGRTFFGVRSAASMVWNPGTPAEAKAKNMDTSIDALQERLDRFSQLVEIASRS